MTADLSTPFSRLADQIEADWPSMARRPEQLPPAGDWSIWLVLAGRGWGKTRVGAEWVRSLAEAASVGRIALLAATASDCRDTLVEGESGLLSIAPNSNRPVYEPSKRRLVWPNGVQAAMFSSEEPDRLRGPQFAAAWVDELAAFRNLQATWDNLQFGLRLGKRPRQVITTTPRPIKLLRELLKREGADVVVTRGSTFANRKNLAESFFSQIVKQYEGTRLGRQELDAEMLETIEGALWSHELLDLGRRAKGDLPVMRRIVVAVDPAVSVSEASDETGIIVAGLGDDGHGYILEDASGKFSPDAWARRVVTLYRKWGADRVIAESNQGGALVEATVRTVDANVSYKAVHASRGKVTRAEPVAALYEQSRVHHVGAFAELEDQLATFSPGSSSSPDRLDALVHGLTELMVGPANDGLINFYREEVEKMEGSERSASDALPETETVELRAPEGCSVVFGMTAGRRYHPDEHGVVHVERHDVQPLKFAGFKQIETEEIS